MKYVLKEKHTPAENPGLWKDSTLLFKVRGSKFEINRLFSKIKILIGENEPIDKKL